MSRQITKKKSQKPRNLTIEHLSQRLVLDGVGIVEPIFFEPTPYLSAADTPAAFNPNPDCDTCITGLEDFEDGTLDFGITISDGQIIGPEFGTGLPLLTDSVDGDDGVIDGTGHTGEGGSSWFSLGNSLLITFPSLMQSAGVVWTDGSPTLTNVVFEAFDQDGNSLGIVDAGDIADDSFMGTTPEDRFFGVSYGDGITTGVTAISITNIGAGSGIEIDHIQFANCAACDCEIDLELSKNVVASNTVVGGEVTWEITVTNNPQTASTDATGVQIGDVLPSGVTLTGSAATDGAFDSNTGIWTLTDPLSPGESETLTLITTIAAGTAGQTLVNTAQVVAADQVDVDSTPNNDDGDQSEDDEDNASVTVTVPGVIDLELAKGANVSVVRGGDLVTFTIGVTNDPNNATTAATNVTITDVIPAGLTVVGIGTSGNSFFANNTWTLVDPLIPGDVGVLTVLATVDSGLAPGTIIKNVAQVATADQIDVDSTPNNDDGDQSEDDEDSAQILVIAPEALMLSGFSYVDTNNDGIFQAIELPLMGVEIQLMGTDVNGNTVNLTTFTNIDGMYKFNGLMPGEYMVTQVQPVQFVDGKDTLGNLGGDDTLNDKFTVTLNDNALDYNFGELGLRPEFVNKRLYLASTPYSSWQFIDVRNATIWHSFDAAHATFLNINALIPNGEGVEFTLFDDEMNVLDVRGGAVLSFNASLELPHAGGYYVRISGDSVIESLSLDLSHVVVDGGIVTATGTSANDAIELTLGADSHVLKIAGETHTFDAAIVTDFHLLGGGGDNTIVVHGTDLDDVANSLDGKGSLTSTAYMVTASEFDRLVINGGGGHDYAKVFGSQGSDTFSGIPQHATLTTPHDATEVDGFERVDAFGRGGRDYATLYGTNGDDLYFARDDYALMSGPGNIAYTKGFERVDAFGRGGDDYAKLYDWDGDETFVAFPTYAYLIGGPRVSYTKGFERVDAYGSTGYDKAVFFDDAAGDDEFHARTQYSYMKNGSSYLNYASGFDEVKAHSRGGNDVAYLLDAITLDAMYGREFSASLRGHDRNQEVFGFDTVIAAALAGNTPSKDIANIDYALHSEGAWL